jgi:hypothetical protein
MMGWDRLIREWETSLDEIESALAADDWESLEGLDWPLPDEDMARPTREQRDRIADLTRRQQAAAAAVAEMLQRVGRELRDAARTRGAVHAYESHRRNVA